MDVYHTSTHGVALVRIQNAGLTATSPPHVLTIMVNFGPLAAEIVSLFQRVSRLGSATARHSSILASAKLCGIEQRAPHIYLAGRPSRWALAHILVAH